ncbi:hypothetical protein GQ54DRAFT_149596 [Martensiomyces pterosporus]|nr:hypothetical protein GQ54DRAFT_149596 [Martensiomyces pterosporus]
MHVLCHSIHTYHSHLMCLVKNMLWRMGRRKAPLLAAACVWRTALFPLCCFSFVCGCPSHASAVLYHTITPFSLACCSLLLAPLSPLWSFYPLVLSSVLLFGSFGARLAIQSSRLSSVAHRAGGFV